MTGSPRYLITGAGGMLGRDLQTALADAGNYREGRYFAAYSAPQTAASNNAAIENHLLPTTFLTKFGQRHAPFGLHYLHCADGTTLGCESCEELWTPRSSHVDLALRGVMREQAEIRERIARHEADIAAAQRVVDAVFPDGERLELISDPLGEMYGKSVG